MERNMNGYYRGYLETNGFKTPFVVYAVSPDHAASKALKGVGTCLENVFIHEIEGPYYNVQM